MRILLIIILTSMISCAQVSPTDYDNTIQILQNCWHKKTMDQAASRIKDFKLIEGTKEFLSYGVTLPSGAPRLTINVSRKDKKIHNISIWLFERGKDNAKYIKSQIAASDWKVYEHPVKQHPLRIEISEYSESKGVSFLYDKVDPKKEVRILYWGADPKKINF